MICIRCGRCNSNLYTVYNKTNIKLNECNRCNQICDEYMEKNTFIILMNILFLKPEIYRHIVFNRLKYHDKFIHSFFFKMIILFLIINSYLHPNFESENIKKSTLSEIFLMNNNFESTLGINSLSYNCSSYTLFMYKYDNKYKLYGLYNIFNNSNFSNLVNVQKDKYLTCIVNSGMLTNYNLCLVNKEHKDSLYYDKQIIDMFLHKNINYSNKFNNNEFKLKKKRKKKENNHWMKFSTSKFIKKVILFLKEKIKYKSIFKLKKNNLLLKNNVITFKNLDEYNNLFQIINILVYYNLDDYKIVFETKEKEAFNLYYIMKFLNNIFFYEKSKKKNYIKSESNTFIKKDSSDFCFYDNKESVFNNICYDYNYLDNHLYGLKSLCKKLLRNINFILKKNAEEIKKKKNKNEDNFQIKQISIYSKLLYSELDNEKYILKICNSSFSLKRLKSVTINYITYFLLLCIFTHFLKLYQQKKYKINITMIKYNYLFMLFVLSNYPSLIYFILKVFNYNYINIYLNIYTIICNIIAYHIFISNDDNYICYSIFSVLISYILKNLLMIKINTYI
ncbi:conserved Plasmodium protein, unknown function [Plasmodium gallinaceum]|uniref:Protein ARV n=1 Tax=Plasmodium gallinaceum TaxID=5849 RepID=A0A1J1GPE1_PLAGA|nr:conserved Plasmodium protein, unknown function [Plasmodium gallinaceum]CRG94172.1 conserved Plasmodium protein, unknown function [Plasmodium gallinaceum]